MAYTGVIEVRWDKVAKIFNDQADLNGDGKVDQGDAEAALKILQERLMHNMGPAGAGFGAGFVMGLKMG